MPRVLVAAGAPDCPAAVPVRGQARRPRAQGPRCRDGVLVLLRAKPVFHLLG